MSTSDVHPEVPRRSARFTRRELLKLGGAVAIGSGVGGAALWWERYREGGCRADVFIARAASYEDDLTRLILDGLQAVGVDAAQVRGKQVLLKPNLVETAVGQPHINTHPAVVLAAAEAFRRLDAAGVVVAEGQGHRRDSWLVLEESGMHQALEHARLPFVDLNHDALVAVPNAGSWTALPTLYLPRTVRSADIVVSLPKIKTHHWTGVTCAMKNLFGVMPGIVYGWPKNALHFAGIHRSILDIHATVGPTLAIADGIIGMEGDGPVMGRPKPLGALVVGTNLPALDATCVRLMGLNPYGIAYLRGASGHFGPVHPHNIQQLGEPIAALRSRFEIIDAAHLASVGRAS